MLRLLTLLDPKTIVIILLVAVAIAALILQQDRRAVGRKLHELPVVTLLSVEPATEVWEG